MKKLITILFLAFMAIAVNAQGLFTPVTGAIFEPTSKAIKLNKANSVIIPRLNVGVEGMSYGKNDEGKLEVVPFSAVIFGLVFLHYKDVDGVPFNDFGIMPAYLQLTDKAGSGVGLYGTYNTGQVGLLNLGGHYDFAVKKFLIDTGLTWHF